MTTIRVAQNDTYLHEMDLVYNTGVPINLTAATAVWVDLENVDTGLVEYRVVANVVTPATGTISFRISGTESAAKKMFVVRFKILGPGDVMTTPNVAEQGLWIY